MNTMIDRVAEVLADSAGDGRDYTEIARSVVGAMRDIDSGSPAILKAGMQSLYSCSSDPELDDARQCWQAMIDAALAEAPSRTATGAGHE